MTMPIKCCLFWGQTISNASHYSTSQKLTPKVSSFWFNWADCSRQMYFHIDIGLTRPSRWWQQGIDSIVISFGSPWSSEKWGEDSLFEEQAKGVDSWEEGKAGNWLQIKLSWGINRWERPFGRWKYRPKQKERRELFYQSESLCQLQLWSQGEPVFLNVYRPNVSKE